MSVEDQKPTDKCVPALATIPKSLPALARANMLLLRAAEQSFDWPDTKSVIKKIKEELGEVEKAIESGDKTHTAEEIGDLLSAVANLARFEGIDPEASLQAANEKFITRYSAVERILNERGHTMKDIPLTEMIRLWNEQKVPSNSSYRSR